MQTIKKLFKYAAYIIFSNTLYGIIVFFTFTWLVGYSLLLAYLGNLVLIIIGLLLDENTLRMFKSKKIIAQFNEIKDEKSFKLNYNLVQYFLDSFISFKTTLYMFYVFILVFTQVINYYPELVGEKLGNFIHANEYTILILIAFDMLISQFLKDRIKMNKISEEFNNSLNKIKNKEN